MEIEVKASQVLKTGTNKSGEWELIKVTSQDGTEYTTFDKKAKKLGSGAVIDIGEPVIKEGKISFKEVVKVVKEGQAAAVSSGSYQADPIKMASEERRSRMHAIKDLWVAGKLDEKTPEVIKMRKWLMEGQVSPPAAPKKTEPIEDISPEETEAKSNIDTDWLKETLDLIHWKETTVLSWIKANLKIEATGKLLDVCNKMSAEQLEQFVAKLRDMRDAAGG